MCIHCGYFLFPTPQLDGENPVKMVIVMTVEPGFGGQKFMSEMVDKEEEEEEEAEAAAWSAAARQATAAVRRQCRLRQRARLTA
ncbi:Ribulose-phosphate 3-epimerase, cytoplasmic isoform [Camellia lanceoleosa]|uniref:Ribulose-phosphate 3-epimerase, cytoplasmic isoform n=1 Tax=Camellia lanceoleosa TaxID=1840588 RepID=A0ACC0J3N2_9ERIC|nr:Ribulose-phosphate 3-epimerase, cytoplasmic isoform [Camellia lanceoleosa]